MKMLSDKQLDKLKEQYRTHAMVLLNKSDEKLDRLVLTEVYDLLLLHGRYFHKEDVTWPVDLISMRGAATDPASSWRLIKKMRGRGWALHFADYGVLQGVSFTPRASFHYAGASITPEIQFKSILAIVDCENPGLREIAVAAILAVKFMKKAMRVPIKYHGKRKEHGRTEKA